MIQKYEWSAHGLTRMLQKGISREAVKSVLTIGEIIEDYPGDTPFPSFLMFGLWQDKALHVVAAMDNVNKTTYIITAYWPDEEHFEPDFKTRRKK